MLLFFLSSADNSDGRHNDHYDTANRFDGQCFMENQYADGDCGYRFQSTEYRSLSSSNMFYRNADLKATPENTGILDAKLLRNRLDEEKIRRLELEIKLQDSEKDIAASCPGAVMVPGLSIRGHQCKDSEEMLASWAKEQV